MKKVLTMIAIAAALALAACSQDDGHTADSHSPAMGHEHALLASPPDAAHCDTALAGNRTETEVALGDTVTRTGYDTCYVSETCRLFLGEGPARACGLEPGFYIGKGATAIVMPNISGTADGGQWLAPLDSPGCGLSDFGTGTQRGFSYTVRDDGIRMYTYCFYIECDYNGTRYGRWVPCAPDDVEWRYRVATLTGQQED